ncbi:hypothetical protein BJ508DRAFT_139681 [Ascobolus immersus RN42]|uniref:Uncharacterized protein n=1 Tax=Ascobolus immersus RN42 TaxID=1160509 RepID=A0A3N4I0R5_ASCIM|nr:hypothetical protein BJ508DRAFT_139681 [Ascobolus immersus RN42]
MRLSSPPKNVHPPQTPTPSQTLRPTQNAPPPARQRRPPRPNDVPLATRPPRRPLLPPGNTERLLPRRRVRRRTAHAASPLRTRDQLDTLDSTLDRDHPPPRSLLTPDSDTHTDPTPSSPPLSPTPITTKNLGRLLTETHTPRPISPISEHPIESPLSSHLVESPLPWDGPDSSDDASSRPVSLGPPLTPFSQTKSTPSSSHHADEALDEVDPDDFLDDPDSFHRLSLLLIQLKSEAQAAISSTISSTTMQVADQLLEIISRPTSPMRANTLEFQSLNAPPTSDGGVRRRKPPSMSIDTGGGGKHPAGGRPGQRRSRSMADDMFRSILRSASQHRGDGVISPISREGSPRVWTRGVGVMTPPLTGENDESKRISRVGTMPELKEDVEGEEGKEQAEEPGEVLERMITEILGIGEARREEERVAGVVVWLLGLGLTWMVVGGNVRLNVDSARRLKGKLRVVESVGYGGKWWGRVKNVEVNGMCMLLVSFWAGLGFGCFFFAYLS